MVAVDDKAFSPSCMLRSKLGVTDATAVGCLQNFMLKRPTAAVALHLAAHQLRHAAQHQHHHVVVQHQHHHVDVQHQHHHVDVQHQQRQAVVVASRLQFRPDAALAEQLWMLAQSAPGLQHQPFQQHLLLQHRLVTKLQQRKLFESFAIRSIKTELHKNLDNRAAISIEIQLGFFVCIDLVSSNSN